MQNGEEPALKDSRQAIRDRRQEHLILEQIGAQGDLFGALGGSVLHRFPSAIAIARSPLVIPPCSGTRSKALLLTRQAKKLRYRSYSAGEWERIVMD